MKENSKTYVSLIPSFHYDVAYLKNYDKYLKICCQNISRALEIMEQYSDYRFTIEQVILVREYWNRFPENRGAMLKFVREGRLAFAPGMYAMPDMNMPEGDSLFMQIKLGKDWLRETFGVEPDVCWIADCWGHHAQLPQILTQAGYRYYVFWRAMRRDVMMNDFLWKGLDGTVMKTHWLADGYSGISFPNEAEQQNKLDLGLSKGSADEITVLCEKIMKYSNQGPVMICNGGDFTVPQASAVGEVAKFNKVSEKNALCFSTPKEHLELVPWNCMVTVGGEFNSLEQGTFTTNIRIKQNIKRLSRRMHALESMSAVIRKTKKSYSGLWEILLKQQFHDIICGSICDDAVRECFAEISLADQKITAEMKALQKKDGTPCYFNPTGFERTEIVEHENKKYVASLKPFGFTRQESLIELTEKGKPVLPCSFENKYYSAQIDKNGYIISLIEKKTRADLVNNNGIPFGELSMQMDYGDPWLNFEGPISGGSLESSLEQNHRDPYSRAVKDEIVNRRTFGAAVTNAAVSCHNSEQLVIIQDSFLEFWKIHIPCRTTVTFLLHSPVIRYQTELMPSGRHYRIRAAFPTSVSEGIIKHEIPFGIQQRGPGEHVCQNWSDYSNERCGLALLNNGIPSNNTDKGIMMLSLFRSVAMEYKTESILSYNENVPHIMQYAIMAHAAGHDEDIVKQAQTFVNPPVLCCVDESFVFQENFSTNCSNVIISALRPQDNGAFLRVYEAVGKDTKSCRINLPECIVHYATADGLQSPMEEFTPCSGNITFDIKAFEIKNIIFNFKSI